MKTGDVAFIASNCNGGGALFRTRYVSELMNCAFTQACHTATHHHADIKVDSYGECLHNKKFPPDLSSMDHYWKNPGSSASIAICSALRCSPTLNSPPYVVTDALPMQRGSRRFAS